MSKPDPSVSRGALFGKDLLASVVVFLVALPLCMGIAIASGAPPAAGLITGIVGGLLVGLIQGAPLQVSGPAAGLAVIIFELVQKHGIGGVGIIVLMAGAIQVAAGVLRGGRWFRAVPPSVIHGMLAGIGVLIFAGQFHVMVDDKARANGLLNIVTIPIAVYKGVMPNPDLPHEEAAIIGVLTIVTIVLWTKFAPKKVAIIPGALVGVALSTLIANVLDLPIARVTLPDRILDIAAVTEAGRWSSLASGTFWIEAVAVAVVASAETLLCATAVDRMHDGPRTNYDRELAAQGVGNVVCGALGGLPMTGVIVRSGANVQAGAKTRLSAILHGAWILVLVSVFPAVLRQIPVSSLAAVLVFTGYKLVNVQVVKELVRYSRTEVVIYFVTVTGIVVTDLLKGVLIGLGIAIAKILYDLSRLHIDEEVDASRKLTKVSFRGSATFLRLPEIAAVLERVPTDHELIVGFDHVRYVDHAVLELLRSVEQQHRAKGATVTIDWDGVEERFHVGRGKTKPNVANALT